MLKTRTVNVGPIRFPEPMILHMDMVADQLGHTRSSLIRLAVREYLRAIQAAR